MKKFFSFLTGVDSEATHIIEQSSEVPPLGTPTRTPRAIHHDDCRGEEHREEGRREGHALAPGEQGERLLRPPSSNFTLRARQAARDYYYYPRTNIHVSMWADEAFPPPRLVTMPVVFIPLSLVARSSRRRPRTRRARGGFLAHWRGSGAWSPRVPRLERRGRRTRPPTGSLASASGRLARPITPPSPFPFRRWATLLRRGALLR